MVIHMPFVSYDHTPLPDDDELYREGIDETEEEDWLASVKFVLSHVPETEVNPDNPDHYYRDQLIGAKYGLTAARWADRYNIPNLTLDQAINIYHEEYWNRTHAKWLMWPLCLLHFDTAVMHGNHAAEAIMEESGHDVMKYLALRIEKYISLKDWAVDGKRAMKHLVDLLRGMAV